MTVVERLWSGFLTGLRPLLPLAGLASRKVARGVAERRGAVARMEAWRSEAGAPDRPVVWLHGASAGELVGAAPTVRALRQRRNLQLVVTYFSPSGEAALEVLRPGMAEALPLDTRRETRRAIRATAPDVLVFAKLDVWPNLTRSAEELGVPLALVNATVGPGSTRMRWPVRPLLRPAYARLDRVGASSPEDARRLLRLGVREEALEVTGDAAFDWALERVRRAREDPASAAAALRRLAPDDVPVLLAGSTWRADESLLLAAVGTLYREGRLVWPVLVPHEPGEEAMAHLRRTSQEELGVDPVLWSERTGEGEAVAPAGDGGRARPPPLVVDRTGILAELYGEADLAWVGGGLGNSGLHSVVEPAAAGIPVLFGARGDRREARELVRRGAARRVSQERAVAELAALLDEPARREEMGREARRYVEEEAGAASRGAELVLELMDAPGRAPGAVS